MRKLVLKVYFKDSPHPWTFEEVTNMTCEGGLLRITQSNTQNQWFPLCSIFRIVELYRAEHKSNG